MDSILGNVCKIVIRKPRNIYFLKLKKNLTLATDISINCSQTPYSLATVMSLENVSPAEVAYLTRTWPEPTATAVAPDISRMPAGSTIHPPDRKQRIIKVPDRYQQSNTIC